MRQARRTSRAAGYFNLDFSSLQDQGTATINGANNITGTDPMPGPLRDNGGSTLTHALLPGSPAIDAADNPSCESTDQRGRGRPSDGDGDQVADCDMGAFELPSDDMFADGFESP